MRSLGTGFVYTSHDLSEDLLDSAYGMLADFFALPDAAKARSVAPESHGQTRLHRAARRDRGRVGARRLEGDAQLGCAASRAPSAARPLPAPLPRPGAPRGRRAGHRGGARRAPPRASLDLQTRFLRVIAVGLGADERYFDDLVADGSHLTRAIHYPPMAAAPAAGHVWADAHADINLITALPRAIGRRPAAADRRRVGRRRAAAPAT